MLFQLYCHIEHFYSYFFPLQNFSLSTKSKTNFLFKRCNETHPILIFSESNISNVQTLKVPHRTPSPAAPAADVEELVLMAQSGGSRAESVRFMEDGPETDSSAIVCHALSICWTKQNSDREKERKILVRALRSTFHSQVHNYA